MLESTQTKETAPLVPHTGGGRSDGRTVGVKLDPVLFARLERVRRASGMSRATYLRSALIYAMDSLTVRSALSPHDAGTV